MLFEPKALSTTTLPKEELENDLRNAKRFGPCAIGDRPSTWGAICAIAVSTFLFPPCIVLSNA